MSEMRVEHSTADDDASVHYATLIIGNRGVIRIPIPQDLIDAAEAAASKAMPSESMILAAFGSDPRKAALEGAADAAMCVHLAEKLL